MHKRRETNCTLRSRHTFGMDVYAEEWREFSSEEEVRSFLQAGGLKGRNHLVAGAGSNLLFCGDFKGIILHSALHGIEVREESPDTVQLRVGSGMNWDSLVAYCVSKGWGGLENLSLIPGEVGASAVQNIGAYGSEVSESIVSVEAIRLSDASKHVFTRQECEYGYRQSAFKNQWKETFFITHVTYRLSVKPVLNLRYKGLKEKLSGVENPTPADVREAVIRIRREKLPDPSVCGNAGSFFMNPVITRLHYASLQKEFPELPHYEVDEGHVKVPAAWLIERCGWKGKTVGRAGVHEHQALILVNRGNATAGEVLHLAALIGESVREKFGINLCPEVTYVR